MSDGVELPPIAKMILREAELEKQIEELEKRIVELRIEIGMWKQANDRQKTELDGCKEALFHAQR